MNERIKELAMELSEQLDWNPPHEPTYYTFAAEDLEKFAELIVRECVNRVRSRQMFAIEDTQNVNHAFDLLIYDIESHFGVEE
jgi:hypothetical protein